MSNPPGLAAYRFLYEPKFFERCIISSKAHRAQRSPLFILIAILSGLAIGGLTLLLQKWLPDNFLQFANSGAVWSVLGFVLGRYALSRRSAIAAGLLGLVGEVAGYFVAAYFANLMDISAGTLAVVGYWLLVALVAGPFFGWAGYTSLQGEGGHRLWGWPR